MDPSTFIARIHAAILFTAILFMSYHTHIIVHYCACHTTHMCSIIGQVTPHTCTLSIAHGWPHTFIGSHTTHMYTCIALSCMLYHIHIIVYHCAGHSTHMYTKCCACDTAHIYTKSYNTHIYMYSSIVYVIPHTLLCMSYHTHVHETLCMRDQTHLYEVTPHTCIHV